MQMTGGIGSSWKMGGKRVKNDTPPPTLQQRGDVKSTHIEFSLAKTYYLLAVQLVRKD